LCGAWFSSRLGVRTPRDKGAGRPFIDAECDCVTTGTCPSRRCRGNLLISMSLSICGRGKEARPAVRPPLPAAKLCTGVEAEESARASSSSFTTWPYRRRVPPCEERLLVLAREPPRRFSILSGHTNAVRFPSACSRGARPVASPAGPQDAARAACHATAEQQSPSPSSQPRCQPQRVTEHLPPPWKSSGVQRGAGGEQEQQRNGRWSEWRLPRGNSGLAAPRARSRRSADAVRPHSGRNLLRRSGGHRHGRARSRRHPADADGRQRRTGLRPTRPATGARAQRPLRPLPRSSPRQSVVTLEARALLYGQFYGCAAHPWSVPFVLFRIN